jgi:hypothetical protein
MLYYCISDPKFYAFNNSSMRNFNFIQIMKPLSAAMLLILTSCMLSTPDSNPEEAEVFTYAYKYVPYSDAGLNLREKMPYGEMASFFERGNMWPLVNPACKENVTGNTSICTERPETHSCTRGGLCEVWFAHSGLAEFKIRLDVQGDTINSWQFYRPEQDAPFVSDCPTKDFEEFLPIFASDLLEQKKYSGAFISTIYQQGDNISSQRSLHQAIEDYPGIQVTYKDGNYYAMKKGKLIGSPLKLRLKNELNDYKAIFSDNRQMERIYTFQSRHFCWYLSGDDEPRQL